MTTNFVIFMTGCTRGIGTCPADLRGSRPWFRGPIRVPSATMHGLPSFNDLPLHQTLAATISRRGYESPTPVQAAVLDPGLAGRDLLVSSQTGSGKTLAFGVLVAERLLAAAAATP